MAALKTSLEFNLPTLITILVSAGGVVGIYATATSHTAVMEQRLSVAEKDLSKTSDGVLQAKGDVIGLDRRVDAIDARAVDFQRRIETALERLTSVIDGLRERTRKASLDDR